MPQINVLAEELVAKLVYWGPAQSGKTQHLAYLAAHAPPACRGRLVQLAAETEHALLFEFLPLALGRAGPLATRWHAYTVPGQVGAAAAGLRRAVLAGADGVLFVADARPGREDDNRAALEELRAATSATAGCAPPTVLVVNHADAAGATPPAALASMLGWSTGPVLSSCARRGEGVAAALRTLAGAVVRRYVQG